MSGGQLAELLTEIRACAHCTDLPLGPKPVLRGEATARLLIISQAPGTLAHKSGLTFNDPSGARLRAWLEIGREAFYDASRVAIMPMGFCYPGRLPRGGDAPPRPDCAPRWHERVMAALPSIELTLFVGSYAIRHYLQDNSRTSMTETVRAWREFLPARLPLPHPSWRTTAWERNNPWFQADLVPVLRRRVARLI